MVDMKFHYGYVHPKCGDKARLLFTDTDSLCYKIETLDVFKDISPDVATQFDTSNYPKVHPSGIPTGLNKCTPSLMKDESSGEIMEEFVGLCHKLYSCKMWGGGDGILRAKGVKTVAAKKGLSHGDFLDCLRTKQAKYLQVANLQT